MGRIDNNKLFYTIAGLLLGAGVLLSVFSSKTNNFLSSQKYSALKVVTTASGGHIVTGKAPRASWKQVALAYRDQRVGGDVGFDSGHKASSTYANDYVPAQEANHPLVASTKFIKKRDLKNKPKKGAKVAKGSSSGKNRFSPLSASPSGSSAGSLLAGVGGAAGAGAKKNTPKDEEENINSVEFWIEPILVNEDATAVSKLVDSFKNKKVSSSVFFEVLGQMNEDTRANIREMGISALGVSPSTQSFSHLAWIKHNDTEAELRTEAGRHVAGYTEANKLGYVVSALRSANTEPLVAVEALKTLTESTKKYADLFQQGSGSSSGSKVDPSALDTRYTKALEVIEQNNLSNSNDSKLKTEATNTVAAINKFKSI